MILMTTAVADSLGKYERESRVGLIAVHHLAMTTFERFRPIRPTRCRRLRVEQLWYEACQAKHHRSSNMAEEASAGRDGFGSVRGIGRISPPSWAAVAPPQAGTTAPRISRYSRFELFG